ncbi:hypothetical protein VCSRO161_3638 [Vibrio cholerae]|nr:hypothetical protein VCSRO150_3528 [Vibrio cholerae]GHY03165.1 hypothetical protein VCSRO161_3638 [Vibrio cholerae]GHY45431.1 hypothetical protein VCSRO165_3507 [Vibrio cholerae]GIA53881.1 hypothetical protein VCSRO180_3595 [Vibrio cholerae]
MKKTIALSIALALSTSAFASEMTHADKSGHTIHIGISKLSGDLSDISDDSVFSLGYDYTTKTGAIIGGYYMPELLSVSASYMGVGVALESSVLGIYSGYQFDNNIRLTAGLSFTYSEAAIATAYESAYDDETNVGIMVGVDYLFNEKFLLGTRLSTHDVGGVDGTTIGLNAGYKF